MNTTRRESDWFPGNIGNIEGFHYGEKDAISTLGGSISAVGRDTIVSARGQNQNCFGFQYYGGKNVEVIPTVLIVPPTVPNIPHRTEHPLQ